MKRMFVDEELQGRGVSRALGQAIIDVACAAGYRRMLLDTSVRQTEAKTLYHRLGFRSSSRTTSCPPTWAAG
jgi:GNAT superfamily N-acetyltransferase